MPFVLIVILAAVVSFVASWAAAWNLDRAILFAANKNRVDWEGTSERALFFAKSIIVPASLVTLSIILVSLRFGISGYPSWLTCVFGVFIGLGALIVHFRLLSQITSDDLEGEALGKIIYDFLVVGTFAIATSSAFTFCNLDSHLFLIIVGVILLLSGLSFISFVNLTCTEYQVHLKKTRRRPKSRSSEEST